ncbi:MAG: transcriptional regulator [Elusimicrobia bacterium GWA2_69_24]|nr:MAG: transcriptional regulator [Elusimicrobia bacterium GWA2_69_24]HBL19121.1 YebC/PmpR family DNA-binding transcriptional regulator [Elusimicrobiota bacterium]
MSGHSKWATIKHKKAAQDSKRGKIWTKLVREIAIAAKMGGGNPDSNPRLRKAVDDAKSENMPLENVKRAIQRGTGELPGAVYEDLTFEGYGPGGVAVFCEGNTDNRNRTTNQVRKIYEDFGGNMGSTGCVAFLFERKGFITVKQGTVTEESLMDLVLELGAEDLKAGGSDFEIVTPPLDMEKVRDALKAKGIAVDAATVTMIPKTTIPVDAAAAGRVLKLVDALDEHDDVAHVYANFDIPDEVMATLEKSA